MVGFALLVPASIAFSIAFDVIEIPVFGGLEVITEDDEEDEEAEEDEETDEEVCRAKQLLP